MKKNEYKTIIISPYYDIFELCIYFVNGWMLYRITTAKPITSKCKGNKCRVVNRYRLHFKRKILQ